MGIIMSKGFSTSARAAMKLVNERAVRPQWDGKSLQELLTLYEVCLSHDFNNAAEDLERYFKSISETGQIVPRDLFKLFNPSMLSVPFAETIWKLRRSNYAAFLENSFKRYSPPSFVWYTGYLLAIGFENYEGAECIKNTIKSFEAVDLCMPAFLKLAIGDPRIATRIADLYEILSSTIPIGEAMTVTDKIREMQEDIEKHDTLNPLLFDDTKLKPEVKQKASEVADELLAALKDVGLEIKIKDLVITGSNASYNYTKDSDIDLHLIADMEGLTDPEGLYPIIFDSFRSAFNRKYEIDFYGIPVEVYIESADTPVVSNGIYSILNDSWVKEPENEEIPEIDLEELDQILQPWKDRYEKLISDIKADTSTDETPIDDFLNELYELRAEGLKGEGEYSFENLTFKELRNLGCLDNLKELRDRVIENRLSLSERLEEDFDGYTLDDYKTKIWSLTGRQPLMQENGIFEIYNVPEAEALQLVDLLNRQEFVSHARLSSSKFDYSKVGAGMRPSRIYKILGQL